MDINYREHFQWLDEPFFENILRRDRQNGSLRILAIDVNEALAKGENYFSQMLRVTAKFDDASSNELTESFIAKGMLISNVPGVIAEMKFFHKEIVNYEKVLPALEALLRSIGDNAVMSAKLHAANEELKYLVFEDLLVRGFANMDRKIGFRVEDFKIVFKKIAKWHAGTAIIIQQNPALLESFSKITFDRDNATWRRIIGNISTSLGDACLLIPGLEHLSEKFTIGQATIYDRFCDAAASNPNGINVLIHGDLWSNNIMFQRHPDTGSVEDVLFVDFQMSCITSPMLDIIYALFTSSHEDLNEVDWEELIQFYQHELIVMLRKLDYDGHKPTLIDFHTEMLTRGTFGAMFGLFVLITRSGTSAVDMRRVGSPNENDREYRRDLFLRPECRKGLEYLLRYCDRKGLLD